MSRFDTGFGLDLGDTNHARRLNMKFTWILALMTTVSSFALDTYECKDLVSFDDKDTYYIVRIGTLNRVTHTEYDDKSICERDAAQMEAKEKKTIKTAKSAKTTPTESNSEEDVVDALLDLMGSLKTEQGWRNDGTLLWEKLKDGSYYCYDKNGMNAVKRVKEAKWCK